MCALFKIDSSTKSYDVEIVADTLAVEDIEDKVCFFLIDEHLLTLWPHLVKHNIIPIPANEESKTLVTVAAVIEQLRTLGANRDSHLIAIGGGVIQDVATFTASSYMRGIPWTYYPTTLLGMVDSCVGGKSSINVGQYKNIAGNFYPPDKITINANFCTTLPGIEVIAGLCEAVKICFAEKGDAFDQYLQLTEQNGLVAFTSLHQVIALSLMTKKKFIEEDEFDAGVRLLLNFGHTFGHAIEAASHFSITHGVAVGLGMQVAIHVAKTINIAIVDNPRVAKLASYLEVLLGSIHTLPAHLHSMSAQDALDKFKSDKKHRINQYAMILPDRNGFLHRHFIPITDHANNLIKDSFDFIKALYEV